jgi:hypothetical protein
LYGYYATAIRRCKIPDLHYVCVYIIYIYIYICPPHPLASTTTPPHPTRPVHKDGRTPIFAAAWEGKTDAVKELIAAGCDINLAEEVKQKTRLALALALRAFRARLPLAPLATLNFAILV